MLWTHILTGNCVDDIIWGSAEKFGNDGKLVDVILSGEQRLALEHLGKDTPSTPDINFHIVLLPGKHNLGGAVISRGDISGHLGILNSGETKVANLQIAVLVDQDIAGFQVAMYDTGRMDVF